MSPTAASVCFVSPSSYGVLSGDARIRHVGGAQVQQVLIARELQRRGHRVSFVVFDHGQTDGEQRDGIHVFKCYRSAAGLPILRFLHPRLTGLWTALGRAGADVYYQRGAGSETALVGAWCRLRNKRFVFALAHDADCNRSLPLLGGPIERALYRLGLRTADEILAQTEEQRCSLLDAFGFRSTVVRSVCAIPPEADESTASPAVPDQDVLWIGRLSAEKRPGWLLDLARELGNLRFGVVGQSNAGADFAQELEARLRCLPNVVFHGYVPHGDVWSIYRRSRILLCTSEVEGFPNVFLEAWACGVPVLSTVDPGGVICRYGLGQVATTREQLKAALIEVRQNGAEWLERGQRGQRYVETHHAPPSVAADLEAIMGRGSS